MSWTTTEALNTIFFSPQNSTGSTVADPATQSSAFKSAPINVYGQSRIFLPFQFKESE